jgi:hypothetical protein
MKGFVVVFLFILALSGCSSMETRAIGGKVSLQEHAPYEVRVRTPSESLSALVYEFAVQELGKSIDIAEHEPGKGAIEVTFASQGESAFMGTAVTTSNAQAYSSGWYTGNTYYGSGSAHGTSTTVSSGSSFTWQNSTLFIVIRDGNGRRLYSVDYKYKGGWELSGWVVNTPEEAARLCIERAHKQLVKDGVL